MGNSRTLFGNAKHGESFFIGLEGVTFLEMTATV